MKKPSAPVAVASLTYATRPVDLKETKLDYSLNLRYLFAPGDLEGVRKRATDPIWSLTVYKIKSSVVKKDSPVLYYLNSENIKRGFVREELMIIPKDTEMPPEKLS